MKKLVLLLFAMPCFVFAQEQKINKEEIAVNDLLKGSLYTPSKLTKNTDLVIIIAGSGAPDRDGNQQGMNTNALRYLAEGLARNDIAAFSFDKRTIALLASGKVSEKDLSFDDFVSDVKTIIAYFRDKKQFRRIIVAGHSEGSLIGMLAAKDNADAYISIAGAGRTIDQIIEEQLVVSFPNAQAAIHSNLQLLKNGQTFELKDQSLSMIFRESLQPYMISWIKYDPQAEIAKLKMPILLINGTRDIQVPVLDAELLKKAKPDAQLLIITDMNHIFKEVKTDERTANLMTYNNPDLPVKPELISGVNQFIKSL